MELSYKDGILWILLFLNIFYSINCGCPFPNSKLLQNGRFLYQSRRLDANKTEAGENYLLRFKCNKGYVLIGSEATVCVNQRWTSGVPICRIMECTEPPEVLNAFYNLLPENEKYPVLGSEATYTCRAGYELLNDSVTTLKCVLDSDNSKSSWTGDKPFCKKKVTCPDPGKSPDGEREGSSFIVGDVVTFTCNDGFEVVGSNQIECLPWGNWSSHRPLCKPSSDYCDPPPAIPHGIVVGEKVGDYYASYDEVEVLCEVGYSYTGKSRFLQCEKEGIWEDEFKECREIVCDSPLPIANGTILELESSNTTVFPYNFQITYVCDQGFKLHGNSWRFCEHGGWSGEDPVCKVIRCPDPGVPEQGARDGDSFEIGSKVYFRCFTGYQLLGSFERYCRPNGQWSGQLSRCDLKSNYCPNPGIPINGGKNSAKYDMGSVISFYCKPGYILMGSESRKCLKDGTWSGEETICRGKYDFDDSTRVRDSLQQILEEKASEQDRYIREYEKARESMGVYSMLGRTLDLSYNGRLVFYFAFDMSGSVGKINFRKSIKFAKALVKKVGISAHGARAGALTFSSKAKVIFLPVDYSNVQDVLDHLDRIEFSGGGTAASSAFFTIREIMIPLSHEHLGINGQKSIVFIMTDGKANMGGDPLDEATTMKKMGIEIYCIGITGDDNQESLYKLASKDNEKEKHVFILQNYANLDWLIQELTNGTIDYSKCGLGLEDAGTHNFQGRIVGGNVTVKPWPWMAAIFYKNDNERDFTKSKFTCGGSVINQEFVMTAAHCLYNLDNTTRKKENMVIKLGLTNLKKETFLQEYAVRKVYQPKLFGKAAKFDFDVALLRLKRPIDFNPYVRPICLPPRDLPTESTLYKPDQFSLAIGWGHDEIVSDLRESIFTKTVEDLKELIFPIQSDLRCAESLTNRAPSSDFTERMFCAGDDQPGNDACKGDSGGPLMQSQMNDEGYLYWTQVGIVSWGILCGLPNTYGFYSHVQRLRPWIDETIEMALEEE